MSTSYLYSSLMSHGNTLASLLHDLKNKLKTVDNISEDVVLLMNDLVEVMERDRAEFASEECFSNVVKKIEWSLQRFMDFDPQNASIYGGLATKVGKFLSTSQPVAYNHNRSNNNNNKNCNNNNNDTINNYMQDFNFADACKGLTDIQILLLAFFCLHPRGAEIKKKDLLKYWYGSSGTDQQIDYSCLDYNFEMSLKHFVQKKLIELVADTTSGDCVRNKKVGLKHKMSNVIRSQLKELKVVVHKRNSMSVCFEKVVLNVNAVRLTAKTLNWLSAYYPVEILLGNCNDDPTKYIVVEDLEALKNLLSKMTTIYLLSLKGISGIVELPSIVYKHKMLRVLDLSCCPNLESLSQGIHTLRSLLYLDLSECYLLNHIPQGISQLSDLKVLKGFIITQVATTGSKLRYPSPPSALLIDLLPLKNLWKLTIRTREMLFPTNSDLHILCQLECLIHLKITWVGTSSTTHHLDATAKFPAKITKFEMEAAIESTTTQLLKLIAQQKDTLPLRKLYIRGGHLCKLVPDIECKILRLQYLPGLQINCYEVMRLFPKLHRLEMSLDVIYSLLRQSFEIATPCHDRDISWKPSLSSHFLSI